MYIDYGNNGMTAFVPYTYYSVLYLAILGHSSIRTRTRKDKDKDDQGRPARGDCFTKPAMSTCVGVYICVYICVYVQYIHGIIHNTQPVNNRL